jgi:hypothetical protein
MADELVISAHSLTFSKSGDKRVINVERTVIDVAASPVVSQTLSIPTSETALTLPASPGLIRLKNLDATNYIEFGRTTGVYTGKLFPTGGVDYAEFALNGTTLYVKSNTAACILKVEAFSA